MVSCVLTLQIVTLSYGDNKKMGPGQYLNNHQLQIQAARFRSTRVRAGSRPQSGGLKVRVVVIIHFGMNISNPLILNLRAEVFLCCQHGAEGDLCRWAPWPLPRLLRGRSPLWIAQSPFSDSKTTSLRNPGALWDRKCNGRRL